MKRMKRGHKFAGVGALALLTASVCDAALAAPGNVLLSDNFEASTLSGWTVVDEGHLNGPSAWRVIDGWLVQHSNIQGGSKAAGDLRKPGSFLLFDNGLAWEDYSIKLRLRSDDDDALGVMFRVAGEDYYRFSWDKSRSYRRLIKHVAGETSLLAEDRASYAKGRGYDLEIRALGPSLSVSVDGEAVFNVHDDTLEAGSVALYSWSNRASYFDDVKITALVDDVVDVAVSDNRAVLAEATVTSTLAAVLGRPLRGNVVPWRGFARQRTPVASLDELVPHDGLSQLERVLMVANLTGVGLAADNTALEALAVTHPQPQARASRRGHDVMLGRYTLSRSSGVSTQVVPFVNAKP